MLCARANREAFVSAILCPRLARPKSYFFLFSLHYHHLPSWEWGWGLGRGLIEREANYKNLTLRVGLKREREMRKLLIVNVFTVYLWALEPNLKRAYLARIVVRLGD